MIEDTNLAYYDLTPRKYISWDFYSQYLYQEPPFGELGAIVFIRTYSRFINELGRREYWRECCLRVIEYSLSLDTVSSIEDKSTEAEHLFDMMFNLRGFPSGRSLWTAGTLQTQIDGSSGWNCCFTGIDSFSAFSEIFYWLMIGAGTGFSVESKYIDKLPKLNSSINIVHDSYDYTNSKEENTYISNAKYSEVFTKANLLETDAKFIENIIEAHTIDNSIFKLVDISVGDSKEGWGNALRLYLQLLTLPSIKTIRFNYDNVRPAGSRIKRFGGRSSGHQALIQLFDNIIKVVKRCNGNLDSVAVLDIVNSIGLNVVSGGVRRTAEIGLGDINDNKFVEAKLNLYSDPEKEDYRAIRSMSNNSVLLYDNPGLNKIQEIMTSIKSNGEPGFWLIGNSNKLAESPVAGTNPCAEAALDNRATCNLTTQNVVAHVFWDPFNNVHFYDWELAEETIRLITRIGCRQTLATQWHPEWDKIQKRDRLLGVSMTGVQDAFDLLEWSTEEKTYFYQWVKAISINEANKYHDSLGINYSTRITLMKPEGTISQLPTVSSGIHKAYSPYYYRRIRFSKTDPLAQVLLNLGLQPVPENNQGTDLYADVCTTWVFTFAVETNTKIRAIDEDCISQLESYKLAQLNYADRGHNISSTITLAPNEYDTAAQWIYDNWDSIIGVSFLPRYDPVEGGVVAYPLLPYEPTDKEGYSKLKSFIPVLTEKQLIELLTKTETKYEEETLDNECNTGACPVR